MRPAVFQVGGTLYWTILTRNPDTLVAKDADSIPSVAVTKNGTPNADSVTVTKRSATTGIYDCSYNPAAEAEGDTFHFLETATVTGTTTSAQTYSFGWVARCVAVERGTDSAALASGVNVTQIGGDAQSLADLKDFADAGYDPFTNKLTGSVELDSSSLRAALGMSAADLDDQLDAILAAASAGAGTGARTVTITVNDGTTALQNAVVRFTESSNTFRALTNASGVATFNLDDATYTVAVTKSGYIYAGTTMVVNGTETATYSMTATNVTSPTNPDLSAIEVLCLDEDFEAAAGIEVDFRMSAVASNDQNRAYPGAKKTVTSNGSGIARFEGPQGSSVEWKRGTGQVWTAVTLDNDSVTNVTSVIGSP